MTKPLSQKEKARRSKQRAAQRQRERIAKERQARREAEEEKERRFRERLRRYRLGGLFETLGQSGWSTFADEDGNWDASIYLNLPGGRIPAPVPGLRYGREAGTWWAAKVHVKFGKLPDGFKTESFQRGTDANDSSGTAITAWHADPVILEGTVSSIWENTKSKYPGVTLTGITLFASHRVDGQKPVHL